MIPLLSKIDEICRRLMIFLLYLDDESVYSILKRTKKFISIYCDRDTIGKVSESTMGTNITEALTLSVIDASELHRDDDDDEEKKEEEEEEKVNENEKKANKDKRLSLNFQQDDFKFWSGKNEEGTGEKITESNGTNTHLNKNSNQENPKLKEFRELYHSNSQFKKGTTGNLSQLPLPALEELDSNEENSDFEFNDSKLKMEIGRSVFEDNDAQNEEPPLLPRELRLNFNDEEEKENSIFPELPLTTRQNDPLTTRQNDPLHSERTHDIIPQSSSRLQLLQETPRIRGSSIQASNILQSPVEKPNKKKLEVIGEGEENSKNLKLQNKSGEKNKKGEVKGKKKIKSNIVSI